MPDFELNWEDLDAAFEAFEVKEINPIVRGLTVELWNGVLSKTPQFYGRMAASWTYSIGSPIYEDRSRLVIGGSIEDFARGPLQALWRGHRAAIDIANTASAGAEMSFKLGDEVWFANGVDHGEGPYSQAIEDGEISLRMMNRPGTPVSRTLDAASARYGEQVSARKAEQFKSMRI